MDFKSLIQKIDSLDDKVEAPKAPESAKAIKLDEGAELKVLAGTRTLKESVEAVVEAEKKETTWTDKSGKKHPATQVKGDKYTGKEAEKEEKSKKKTDESTEYDAFKAKFMQMVEAKKAEEAVEKKEKKSKKEKMEEAAKPDFLDMDKDGDKKEPMKKAVADKKKGAVKKTEESKMMPKGKKRPVKESVERQLTFREMMKLVVESGGQQQIDPLDQELFAWASRVAKSKLGEGMKAEVYAGMVYERMGGRFEMYDILSEDQK